MPGLRHYTTLDAGTAFGDDWEKAFGRRSGGDGVKKERKRRLDGRTRSGRTRQTSEDDETIAGPPYEGWQSIDSQSTVNLVASSHAPGRAPKMGFKTGEEEDEEVGSADDEEDDGGASDGTQYMTKAERRAYRILQELKADPAWNGTRYRLLEKWVLPLRPPLFGRGSLITP